MIRWMWEVESTAVRRAGGIEMEMLIRLIQANRRGGEIVTAGGELKNDFDA